MSKIQPGNGYGFTSSGYGFSINTEPPFNVQALAEWTQFKVYDNSVGSNTAVSVLPGTVNGVVPKISSVYIDADTPPKISVTQNGTVYLTVTRASGEAFPKTVEINFSPTVPADTTNVGNFALASVIKNGNELKISQFVTNSLIVSRTGYGAGDAIFYWFRV
jgi:hypothetical protein